MKQIIITYLPYLLSGITIWMFLMAGNKKKSAWLIGLLNQFLWMIWIVLSQSWGLLPMNIALWVVYTRNYLKWKQELKEDMHSTLEEMKGGESNE